MAPYSLFVSLAMFVALAPELVVGHYVATAYWRAAVGSLLVVSGRYLHPNLPTWLAEHRDHLRGWWYGGHGDDGAAASTAWGWKVLNGQAQLMPLEVSGNFVLCFFAIDLHASCYWEWGTARASARRKMSGASMLLHAIYGWLNTKTYYLVLLLLLHRTGATIDAGVLLLDWASHVLLFLFPISILALGCDR